MAEYALEDLVPYDRNSWYALFEQYHQQTWPAPLLLMAIASLLVWAAIRSVPHAPPGQSTVATLVRWPLLLAMALAWFWIAWQFHARIHLQLNWAARSWAWAFGIEAIGLTSVVVHDLLQSQRPLLRLRRFSTGLILLPLLAPPLVGWLLAERSWNGLEIAGLAPDPTAWLTVLILSLSATRKAWPILGLMLLPALSLALSAAAAWVLDAADLMVLSALAVITFVGMLIYRYRTG